MKKLMGLLLALCLCFVFVGCGDDAEKQKEKEMEELKKLPLILENDQFEGDTILPDKLASIYKVTWEVEKNEYCELKENEGVYTLVVLKTGGVEIKLTATIHGTIEGNKLTKEFKIYTNIKESTEATIADFMDSKIANGDIVTVKGTIYYICPKGYWITDKADSYLYVYTNTDKQTDKAGKELAIGNEVSVKGEKSLYYSMLELVKPETTLVSEKGSTNISNMVKESTIENVLDFAVIDGKGASARFGALFTVEGVIIADKVGSGYKYNIESIKTKECLVLYDSAMTEANLKDLEANLGKYVKLTGLLWDVHSKGFVRFIPTKAVEETKAPELTDAEKVAAVVNEIKSMNTEIASNTEFVTDFDGVKATWVSANEEVLSNEGKILKQDKVNTVEVKVTVTVELNGVKETVELTFKVLPLVSKTVAEAMAIALKNQSQVLSVKAKVIATENKNYFYIADESGIAYVRTDITKLDLQVGDSASFLLKTTIYYNNNKEITPQLNATEAEKINEEVKVVEAEKVEIATLAEKFTANDVLTQPEIDAISTNALYGKLVKFQCYISVRTSGSYTNVYLAVSAEANSASAYYQHTSLYQNEAKALDGKLVEIVAPVYGYSASYGWRIGTYLSITEVK